MVVKVELAGDPMTFLLGSREASVDDDLEVYSATSPLGAAIIGKKAGDTHVVHLAQRQVVRGQGASPPSRTPGSSAHARWPARMGLADAAWLGLDRPEHLMVVTVVLRLGARVELAPCRTLVADRLVAAYPKFRQRPVRSRWPLVPPSLAGRPGLHDRAACPRG